MPRLEFSERFAKDLALVESPKQEALILSCLDSIEAFGEFGSPNIPGSIKGEFGDGVRKVAINPFDLVYTLISSDFATQGRWPASPDLGLPIISRISA